jgi:hypothetical protein
VSEDEVEEMNAVELGGKWEEENAVDWDEDGEADAENAAEWLTMALEEL